MQIQIAEQLRLYNEWAMEALFKAFDKYGDSMPDSSLRLLSHIIDAQSTWYSRLIGVAPPVKVWDLQTLEFCRTHFRETSRGLKEVIEQHAHEPDLVIVYTNSMGVQFRNRLIDILLQVFNHGTYHRAQIAMDMRSKGLEPVHTDYISFVR